MRILVDMNLSTRWVSLFVESGHEAVHWSAVGLANAPDDALFDYALAHGSNILTNDLGFGIALIARGWSKPSVIQLRSDDLRPATLGGAVLDALDTQASVIEDGALVTVDPRRARFRLLRLSEPPL